MKVVLEFIWENLFILIVLAILICLVVALIVTCCQTTLYNQTKTEVETYTVGCEVTQIAYAEEAVTKSMTKPVYKMGVRCDDFATTFNVTAEQFAKYVSGDIVEVEVVVYEYEDGKQAKEYKLIG